MRLLSGKSFFFLSLSFPYRFWLFLGLEYLSFSVGGVGKKRFSGAFLEGRTLTHAEAATEQRLTALFTAWNWVSVAGAADCTVTVQHLVLYKYGNILRIRSIRIIAIIRFPHNGPSS